MKILNKKNQHEIGFDIDCLPAWAVGIAMFSTTYGAEDDFNRWVILSDTQQLNSFDKHGVEDSTNTYVTEGWYYEIIPDDFAPKAYKGHWEDSLFKIKK